MVSLLIKWKNRANTKLNRQICESRKNVDLFDYQEVVAELPISYEFAIPENNLYGIAKHLESKWPEINFSKAGVEHGFIYGSLVQTFHIESWTRSVVTFSDYRKQYIRKKTIKEVRCVGPYIHYADPILSMEQIASLRSELGHTLLVFPQHTIKDVNLEYNKDEFIKTIDRVGKKFDKVLVCFYYLDIQQNLHLPYERLGYQIVSAGHKYDRYFLRRLKTIFSLADVVLSNSIGTHIGYAVYMNKALILHKQEVSFHAAESAKDNISQRNSEDLETLEQLKAELFELFGEKEGFKLSAAQIDKVSSLFGFEYLR